MSCVHKLKNKYAMLQLHDNFTIENYIFYVYLNYNIYDSENTKQ